MKTFSLDGIFRLDYCGIAILIVGSIVPLLYYQFYCEFGTKVAYLTLIGVLGIGCMVISMWDRFSSSEYRVYRACKFAHLFNAFELSIRRCLVLFITFGVFGFIPTCHYIIRFGVRHAFTGITNESDCVIDYSFNRNQFCFFFSFSAGATQYLLIVAALYVTGACIYAGNFHEIDSNRFDLKGF